MSSFIGLIYNGKIINNLLKKTPLHVYNIMSYCTLVRNTIIHIIYT